MLSSVSSLRQFGLNAVSKFLGGQSSKDLLARSSTSAVWTTSRVLLVGLLGLFSNIIMVRLLDPTAFGLMAFAANFVAAITLFTDMGLRTSVIQSPRATEKTFMQTVFLTKILRGAGIALIITLIGFLFVRYTDQMPEDSIWSHPLAGPFLFAIALNSILISLASPNLAQAERRLEFGRTTVLHVASKALTVPVMITAAVLGAGPWSLIMGLLAGSLVTVILSHTIIRGGFIIPGFNRRDFGEIFHFGKWVAVGSIGTIVVVHGNKLILSPLMVAQDFSLFAISLVWVELAGSIVRGVVESVGLSALSQAYREKKENLRSAYRRFRMVADLCVIMGFLLILFFHGPFFDLIYPEKVSGAKKFIPYAALSLLSAPLALLQLASLAAGDSKRVAGLSWIRSVAVLVTVPWAFYTFGPYAAVAAFAVSSFAGLPFMYMAARKHMKLSWKTEAPLPLFLFASCILIAVFGPA